MFTYNNQNIFAKILQNKLPSYKVYEDAKTLVIMDIMPLSKGHVLVIPKYHSRNILDILPQDLSCVILTTQKISKIIKKTFNADGLTIQHFVESAGGQIIFHTHFHIIPRFNGISLKRIQASDQELITNMNKIKKNLKML